MPTEGTHTALAKTSVPSDSRQLARQPRQAAHNAAGVHANADEVFIKALLKLAGIAVGVREEKLFARTVIAVPVMARLARIIVVC